MGVQEWQIKQPESRIVRIEIGWVLGNVKVMVDGAVIYQRKVAWFSNVFKCEFEIDGVPAMVKSAGPFGFKAEFFLDGNPR